VGGDAGEGGTHTCTLWSKLHYSTGQALSPAYRQAGIKGEGDILSEEKP